MFEQRVKIPDGSDVSLDDRFREDDKIRLTVHDYDGMTCLTVAQARELVKHLGEWIASRERPEKMLSDCTVDEVVAALKKGGLKEIISNRAPGPYVEPIPEPTQWFEVEVVVEAKVQAKMLAEAAQIAQERLNCFTRDAFRASFCCLCGKVGADETTTHAHGVTGCAFSKKYNGTIYHVYHSRCL